MKRWVTIATIAIVLCLPEDGLVADKSDNERPDPIMPEVIVTGTRYDEEVQNIPANVTIITADDIKNSGARNIPELLRTQPGIKVNDINGSRRFLYR